jgi:spoIIIJ-associated protein
MPWIEKEGRTVDEAMEAALSELGLPEADSEIEVLREGARGLFGLGGEPALVRVRPRSEAVDVRAAFHDRPPSAAPEPTPPTPPDVLVEAQATQDGPVATDVSDEPVAAEQDGRAAISLSERQRITTELAVEMVSGILERMGLKGEVNTRLAGGTVYVEVFGDDMGILIGRGGKTLEALQELVRAGVQRKLKARAAVVVDVEAYWERRRESPERRSGGRRREGSGQSGNR